MSFSNFKKKVQRACRFVNRCKDQNFCSVELNGTLSDHDNLDDIVDELNSYHENGNGANALV